MRATPDTPIKSVWVVDQALLSIKAKKQLAPSVEIVINRGFNEILNAYDRFFENPCSHRRSSSGPGPNSQIQGDHLFQTAVQSQLSAGNRIRCGKWGSRLAVRQLDVLAAGFLLKLKKANFEISDFGKLRDHLQGRREAALDLLLTSLKTDAFALDLLNIWVWELNDPWAAGVPDLQRSIKDYTDKHIENWLKKSGRHEKSRSQRSAIGFTRSASKAKLRYVIEQLAPILDKKDPQILVAYERCRTISAITTMSSPTGNCGTASRGKPDCHLHTQTGIIIGWQMMAGSRNIRKFIK